MGASNGSAVIVLKKDENIKKKFRNLQDELEFEHGHSGYNGTLSTCSGLKVRSSVPSELEGKDEDAVFEYIWENTDKWEEAMAIQVSEGRWLIGGWCAS